MKSLEQRLKESDAKLAALREKIDALANDPTMAARPELWEADRNEYFDLLDEVQALYEEKNLLLEERARTPAYDGFSPSLTKKEELAFFRANAIRNRADILAAAEAIREYYRSGRGGKDLPLEQLTTLLDRFSAEVSGLHLMNLTQDWWQYEITVRETDITLSLVRAEVIYDRGRRWTEKNRPFLLPVQQYPLYTTRARLLSPEEFGALYGVSGGTVRQWIRRGKVRSASKFGNAWRIPELTLVRSGERYSEGSYAWSTELPDVPEEFACLNEYRAASVSSVHGKKDRWNVFLSEGENAEEKTLSLDGKAKERLELYLIGEPLVECVNNFLGDFLEKTLREWDGETAED